MGTLRAQSWILVAAALGLPTSAAACPGSPKSNGTGYTPASNLRSLPPKSAGPDILHRRLPRSPQLENTRNWDAKPILISGAHAYRKGEFLYQDFLYDDRALTYPDDPARLARNAADIVEVRIEPLKSATAIRVTLNSMLDPDAAAVTIGLGRADQPRPMPHDAGAKMPAYSTLVGGSFTDYGNAIAVDDNQVATVVGYTYSDDLSTSGAYVTSATTATAGEAFVTRIDPGTLAGSTASRRWGSYLGGASSANAVALDAQGRAFVGGKVTGAFPTTTSAFHTATVGGKRAPPPTAALAVSRQVGCTRSRLVARATTGRTGRFRVIVARPKAPYALAVYRVHTSTGGKTFTLPILVRR